jgi:photosystem II stability/assembly factor-like uncharacterized protein
MTKLSVTLGLLFLSMAGAGQDPQDATGPFTLTWTEGKCLGCKNADDLGEIQFISRSEFWGVGFEHVPNGVNTIVVRSMDAGRTWREVPESQQYTDPDGRLAFSFLGPSRGWIDPLDVVADEGKMMGTRDGGQHWQRVSRQFLQSMKFVDDRHGYGTVANEFLRTDDGGRSWVGNKIPDVRFIDRMIFLTPDHGWIAGTDGKDFLVSRTVNGGSDWEQSRTTPALPPERVRDLFFFDQQFGWLITWNRIGEGAYLYFTVDGGKHWAQDPDLSFQGRGMLGNVIRFTSRETGFFFYLEGARQRLAYTTDGGAHWHKQALPGFVSDCQVLEGNMSCSAAPGFRLLTLHPN